MNHQQATDLIRSHTDYGGSVDVHALALAISSATAVTVLDDTGVVERLAIHARDERNTAFARSTMQDAMTMIGEMRAATPNVTGQTNAEALHDAWQSTFAHMDAVADEPKLTVWYGSMPESNGKTNWTAILHRGDVTRGITLDMSEYPDRVRYEADRMRWMIGELSEEPFILDYDAGKHSGYVASPEPVDAIARSKRILALVDEYTNQPNQRNRDALRHGLLDEFTAPPAASGQKLTYEQINEVWKSANGTYLDRNEFGAMVADFARALLAASDSQGAQI